MAIGGYEPNGGSTGGPRAGDDLERPNLFLPGQDAGPDTQAAFQAKLASLAAVIDQAAPDVAALQEVGPDDVLARLQAALTHPLPHAATGDPDDRGIRVAVLSARPLGGVGVVGPFPDGVRAVQDKDAVFDDPATPGWTSR